jgi:uncharacterized protein (DUF488 family)
MPPNAGRQIYTLGTSTRSFAEFLEILSVYGIQVVIDVRRFPSSRFEQFDRENFTALLADSGIDYIYMGDELGGYRRGGYQDYTSSTEFQTGLDKLVDEAQDRVAVIVCAERLPWRCHRRFIARELEKRGLQVNHVLDRERSWIPKKNAGSSISMFNL